MNADRLNRYAILYELKKTLELEVKKLNAQMAEAEAGILEDFESGEDGIADVLSRRMPPSSFRSPR